MCEHLIDMSFSENHFTLTFFYVVTRLRALKSDRLGFEFHLFYSIVLWSWENCLISLDLGLLIHEMCKSAVHSGRAAVPSDACSQVTFPERPSLTPQAHARPAPVHRKHVTQCVLPSGGWFHTSTCASAKLTAEHAGALQPGWFVMNLAGFMKSENNESNVDVYIFDNKRVLHSHRV